MDSNRHVLKPGTPEHRNTGTPRNTPEHPETPEQPKNPGTSNLTVLLYYSIREHVKNKMSVLFVYPRTFYDEL